MTESKRTPKTPRQRAQEALGVANRRVVALEQKLTKAKAAVTAVETELAEARSRLAYVSADPALPPSAPIAAPADEPESVEVPRQPSAGDQS